jgi:muconolactone delta-isomerase
MSSLLYTARGLIQESWSIAGTQGGGARINVESHEELEGIMDEVPLFAFSVIELLPVVFF